MEELFDDPAIAATVFPNDTTVVTTDWRRVQPDSVSLFGPREAFVLA